MGRVSSSSRPPVLSDAVVLMSIKDAELVLVARMTSPAVPLHVLREALCIVSLSAPSSPYLALYRRFELSLLAPKSSSNSAEVL